MYKLKYGLNWLLPACGVGKKMSPNRFLVYQALDIETNLKERMRIIKTLDGESWDGWDTIHVEKELLEKINKLEIGPGGLGGKMTALGVNVEVYPTHIAGLPVAINMCCHVNRHISRTL